MNSQTAAEMVKMLADCYKMAGADPSGGMKGDVDEDWRLAPGALRAVTELREEYDALLEANERLQAENATIRTRMKDCNELFLEQQAELAEARGQAEKAQAKIDSLMLEYCPDEMTPEQFDNWASHQRRATPDEEAAIAAAIAREGAGQ